MIEKKIRTKIISKETKKVEKLFESILFLFNQCAS